LCCRVSHGSLNIVSRYLYAAQYLQQRFNSSTYIVKTAHVTSRYKLQTAHQFTRKYSHSAAYRHSTESSIYYSDIINIIDRIPYQHYSSSNSETLYLYCSAGATHLFLLYILIAGSIFTTLQTFRISYIFATYWQYYCLLSINYRENWLRYLISTYSLQTLTVRSNQLYLAIL
jgi:hypothetical protein